jgi:hypothetical protein
MIHQSTIGLDYNTNLNTTKIIIHLQESMIESYTCDGTSGISYNIWDSDNHKTTVQLTDDEVDTSLRGLPFGWLKMLSFFLSIRREKRIQPFMNSKT